MRSWTLLASEYPPKVGGVGAYTRNLAVALAAAGDGVDVWTYAPGGELARDAGVEVHALPDRFGRRSILALERWIASRPRARLLVQYVPQGFGMRGMNVPFAVWLAARARPYWVMFHEVAYPIERGARLRHNVLGVVTEQMASLIARGADRTFVSTLAWIPTIARLAPRAPAPEWVPVPSNVPERVAAADVASVRERLGIGPDDVVVGSFGTYAGYVAEVLEGAMRAVLARDPRRVGLLIGKGGEALAPLLASSGARVVPTGELDLAAIPAHLAACTLVVQPYPDGINARRGSAMASLALGVPVVTHVGHGSEPMWEDEAFVALSEGPSAEALARRAEELLGDTALRTRLGLRGLEAYEGKFSLARTVEALRG